jgi:hypothetical protein
MNVNISYFVLLLKYACSLNSAMIYKHRGLPGRNASAFVRVNLTAGGLVSPGDVPEVILHFIPNIRKGQCTRWYPKYSGLGPPPIQQLW